MVEALVSYKRDRHKQKSHPRKIDGKRKERQPPIRWKDDVECVLRILGIRGWKRKAEGGEKRRHIVGAVKAYYTEDDDCI